MKPPGTHSFGLNLKLHKNINKTKQKSTQNKKQVPKDYITAAEHRVAAQAEDGVEPFDSVGRKTYAAMVTYMDEAVGEIEAVLKKKGMWDKTLLVFISDNGGPIYVPGNSNNFPLKGGKSSDWEGGVRTVAFVSGGFVPEVNRGAVYGGVISIADWQGG